MKEIEVYTQDSVLSIKKKANEFDPINLSDQTRIGEFLDWKGIKKSAMDKH